MRLRTDTSLLEMALVGYKAEREKLSEKIAEIQTKLNGRSRGPAKQSAIRPRRKLSAAARLRIAAAQKKRWAKFRKNHKKTAK